MTCMVIRLPSSPWPLKHTYHYHLGWGGFGGGILIVHHHCMPDSSRSGQMMAFNFNFSINYLRAAAPAADPGRIGKEAKQIGIKTLRCFAPWGFRPFSYVYCCEIYLIGLNFHLQMGFSWYIDCHGAVGAYACPFRCVPCEVGGVAVWVAVFNLGWTYNKWHYHKGIFTLWSWTKLHCVARGCLARNCWFVLMVFSFHFFLGWCVWPPLRES